MKIYRIGRWFILAAALVGILLMLRHPQRLVTQPVSASQASSDANSFQSKLGDLEQAHQNGQSGVEARISSDEIAAALAASNPQPSPGATLSSEMGIAPGEVAIKDQQVVFDDDQVKGQFTTQVAGKEVVVTLGGHVSSKNGYVDFVPTSFQIGSMPVPISIVQQQLQKKLSDPATRERLKLPDFVSDLRIENGQLVVVEK